ncbi:ATP-grasp domain-containing protein [Facklamia sp. P12932]|uniref:ATP-grasp domain-containing protein n=1 Tax=Facklamia sp. P12932 TaxID=3421947 RepID=UPI003D162FAB
MAKNKLMILGASPFFKDAYEYANFNNIYTVAIDQKNKDYAICKNIANKSFEISTQDYKALSEIILNESINGIYVGASETNMPIAIQLSEEFNIPFYCSERLWNIATNKRVFKEMCMKYEINVTPFFNINIENYLSEANTIPYPVVTKPVDNNGSTGITICNNSLEFISGFMKAYNNSISNDVLVEKYINMDSTIIHYTMINGKAYFSGMSDKISRKISSEGAPVMALQYFPSNNQKLFFNEYEKKVSYMLESEGFKNGPIWIEAFSDGKDLIFNEMGYRFGGSMTYHPVEYFTGLNQISLLINHTLNNSEKSFQYDLKNTNKIYCIAPIHIYPGTIMKVSGLDDLNQIDGFHALAQCHVEGDLIESSGNVHQVFCYLHLLADSKGEINAIIDDILNHISVKNTENDDMLFRII